MIREARTSERVKLSHLCILSKSFWDYPREYINTWMKELTITSRYIQQNQVYVLEEDGNIQGMYTLVDVPKDIRISTVTVEAGLWLDHFFVHPEYIGQGVGRRMWHDMINRIKQDKIKRLLIFVDPHAKGFYTKMGCRFVRWSDSSIPGRQIPVFEYDPSL